jgi:DNA invertase Pin-like site-specific DNA recombinase
MKRAVLYTRVSSVDQHPETQLCDLRPLAAARGYEIVGEYTDTISGSRAKRPGLDRLMADARRGRFDVVLVWAFDRVARSVKHFLEILDDLNRLNVEFVSFRENIDTGGPLGRAMVVIVGAIAELERSLIVERVKAGMRRAKLEGRQVGRSAAGHQPGAGHPRPPQWNVADAGRQAPQHFESLSMPPDESGERQLLSRRCNF